MTQGDWGALVGIAMILGAFTWFVWVECVAPALVRRRVRRLHQEADAIQLGWWRGKEEAVDRGIMDETVRDVRYVIRTMIRVIVGAGWGVGAVATSVSLSGTLADWGRCAVLLMAAFLAVLIITEQGGDKG